MKNSKCNIKFEYLFRDEGNYKIFQSVVFHNPENINVIKFDKNIIGITPNYNLHVREDILREIDGPMLKYGLQSLQGNHLILPNHRRDYPDRERLEYRYGEFLKASSSF